MKTTRNIITLSCLALIILTAFSACNKSNEEDVNPDAGNAKGSYSYDGRTINSIRGDFLSADGNLYLYVYGQEATDIVQFIWVKKSKLETGDYTFKREGNGYNPSLNFTGGTVISAKMPNGDLITGGKISVKENRDGFEVNMDVTTAAGKNLKGNYTGTFTSR